LFDNNGNSSKKTGSSSSAVETKRKIIMPYDAKNEPTSIKSSVRATNINSQSAIAALELATLKKDEV